MHRKQYFLSCLLFHKFSYLDNVTYMLAISKSNLHGYSFKLMKDILKVCFHFNGNQMFPIFLELLFSL